MNIHTQISHAILVLKFNHANPHTLSTKKSSISWSSWVVLFGDDGEVIYSREDGVIANAMMSQASKEHREH